MSDLTRIEKKLDRLDERLGSIDKTLVAQHVSLEEHIRRTEILESKVEPIEKHVAMINGALKLFGMLCMVGGLIAAILKLFIH